MIGKAQLAAKYGVTLEHFRRQIKKLKDKLAELGDTPGAKCYTPKMVDEIREYLGDPDGL